MTELKAGKPFYVASERMQLVRLFASANQVPFDDVRPLQTAHSFRGHPHGIEVWVLGEIGRDMAEELHYLTVTKGATIKYADCFDVIERKDA